MKKTRQQQIDDGKVWQLYPDSDIDKVLFEGTKTACKKYIQEYKLSREIKSGKIRLGKLIHENIQ